MGGTDGEGQPDKGTKGPQFLKLLDAGERLMAQLRSLVSVLLSGAVCGL